jgi:hypothetical protein
MHLTMVHVNIVIINRYVDRPIVRPQGLLPHLQAPITTPTLTSTAGKRLEDPRLLGALSQHIVVEDRLLKRLTIKIHKTIVAIQIVGEEMAFM